MKTLKALSVSAAAAALFMVTATPANASAASFSPAGTGYAVFNGNTLKVCDTAYDGRRVRAHLRNYPGGPIYVSGWAPSGGCQYEGHLNTYDFRACADDVGCGPWVTKN